MDYRKQFSRLYPHEEISTKIFEGNSYGKPHAQVSSASNSRAIRTDDRLSEIRFVIRRMDIQGEQEVGPTRTKKKKSRSIRMRSNCTNLNLFNHSDSTPSVNTIVTVRGPLPYSSVSPARCLAGLLDPNHRDVRSLLYSCIFSYTTMSYVDFHMVFPHRRTNRGRAEYGKRTQHLI